MTSLSSLEPQACGLIILQTTFGDLEVELFTQQCPKATRNFVQLCLDNYYTGTIFNRVEKDFIAVGGVIEAKPEENENFFKDEFHPRLKFTRRGLLATANTEKDANGSEFFFTLGPTPELQSKHTIFGRLKGDSIYNLVDLNECQVDDDLVPLSEKKILETTVVENPFPDLVPREDFALKRSVSKEFNEKDDYYDPLNKPKSDASKSKTLSFYQDSDDDDDEETNVFLDSKNKVVVVNDSRADNEDQRQESRRSLDGSETSVTKLKATANETDGQDVRDKRLREIRAQIQELKDQITNNSDSKSPNIQQDATSNQNIETQYDDDLSSDIVAHRTADKKKRPRDQETLESLEKFKKKLKKQSNDAKCNQDSVRGFSNHDDEPARSYEKQSAVETELLFQEDNELLENLDKIDGDAWLQHKFVAVDNDAPLAKDANTKDDNWYTIDDPRNPMKKRNLAKHAHEYKRSQDRSHRHDHHVSSRSSERRQSSHHGDQNQSHNRRDRYHHDDARSNSHRHIHDYRRHNSSRR